MTPTQSPLHSYIERHTHTHQKTVTLAPLTYVHYYRGRLFSLLGVVCAIVRLCFLFPYPPARPRVTDAAAPTFVHLEDQRFKNMRTLPLSLLSFFLSHPKPRSLARGRLDFFFLSCWRLVCARYSPLANLVLGTEA